MQYGAVLVGYGTVLKYGAVLVAGICAGLAINAWRYEADIAALEANHARELSRISEESAAALKRVLARQQEAEARAAAVDAKYTKDLADALAENDRLRAVADNERRLRIKATCPGPSGSVPATSGPSGMDDVGTVELHPETGRAVFDLRADLIRDRAMILGLQQYVRDVCLSRGGAD